MNVVVDTSAIVACLTGEPERLTFVDRLEVAHQVAMSTPTLLETRLVVALSKGLPVGIVDDFVADYAIDIVPFDQHLADLAFDAYARFGKGRHAARLNMGDCAAYALARQRGWPLLYKSDDFVLTDIERA